MFVKSIFAVALLASFTAAQSTDNSTIDPSLVDLSTRSAWCSAEISTCGTLCSGENGSNDCTPETLNYTCTCSSNNSAPGLQYYQQSLPSFICQQIYQDCIVAGQNNAAAQKVCTTNRDKNCGTLDITNFVAAASSSSSSAVATSTSASSTASSSATGSAAASTSTAAAGSYQAPGAVAVGLAAAFGLFL